MYELTLILCRYTSFHSSIASPCGRNPGLIWPCIAAGGLPSTLPQSSRARGRISGSLSCGCEGATRSALLCRVVRGSAWGRSASRPLALHPLHLLHLLNGVNLVGQWRTTVNATIGMSMHQAACIEAEEAAASAAAVSHAVLFSRDLWRVGGLRKQARAQGHQRRDARPGGRCRHGGGKSRRGLYEPRAGTCAAEVARRARPGTEHEQYLRSNASTPQRSEAGFAVEPDHPSGPVCARRVRVIGLP